MADTAVPGGTITYTLPYTNTATLTFADIPPGSYDITEIVPLNWQLDSASCSVGSDTASLSGDTLTLALGAGEAVTCTFRNSLPTGRLTIVKKADPADGTDFAFTVDRFRIISTVVGNGTGDFSGNGGEATLASLFFPTGVAFDSSGNLFIVGAVNHRIRKVDAVTGIISTVVGNGNADFSDGAATLASLNGPIGIALDSSDNLFIAETDNHRIRKVVAGFTRDDASPDDSDGIEQSLTISAMPVGTVDISELGPDGWQLDDATCTGGSLFGDTLTISVGVGEDIVCTFTHTKQVSDCTVDGDANIDGDDINLILAARNTPTSGPDDPRDPNGDGVKNVLDARICVLQCTHSRCAP